MVRAPSPIVDRIEALGADGYLVDADSTDSDQRYLSGFDAPDAFVTLFVAGQTVLLVSELEYGRAKTESRADVVDRLSDYDHVERIREFGAYEGRVRTIAAFLEAHGVSSVAVPSGFPTGTADGLRDRGVEVTVDAENVVTDVRAIKTTEEIEHVRTAQRANERAMAVAESLLAGATVDDEGRLVHEGAVLTSERVKQAIEIALLRDGCALDETIVACGADAADPHDRGSGPLLAGEPIIVDIFPRDKETKFHADMTRTFCRGEPSDELRRWFDVTREAYEAALAVVAPGVTGEAVHDAACDVFEEAGFQTLRSDPDAETGFIHSTGHGVGLDVHEQPRVAPGGSELAPGHVITIEPGLYDPSVGGVRIEDLVVVTEDGCENLTTYPVSLEPVVRGE